VEATGVALVTGAGRGIGRALAFELARRGFEVVATLRDPSGSAALAAAARDAGVRLRIAHLDVTQPEGFAMPDGLRVLVNNAGVEAAQLPLEHAPLATWRAVFETNVFGLVALTQLAIPKLRAAGGGVICNLGSASLLVPMPLFAAYRASKAAVAALGESLCVEVAPFGIRVLEIVPGAIATDMLARADRASEAGAFAVYRALAERIDRARRAAAGAATDVARAAAAIADAILDDAAPLRVAPDPMGAALLDAWRTQDDATALRAMLDAFGRAGDG